MFIKDGSKDDYDDGYSFCGYLARDLVCAKNNKKSLNDVLDSNLYNSPKLNNIYMWGWLSNKLPNKNKWQDEDLKFRIISIFRSIEEKFIVDHYCGSHLCEICEDYYFEGSIKIEYKNLIFCCPYGVEHYIESHNYKPDDIVIDAIANGKFLTQGDLTRKGYELYRKQIAKEMKVIKKELLEEKYRNEKIKIEREKYMNSLSERQRQLIQESLSGKLDCIKLN